MGILINQCETKIVRIDLLHPVERVPAVAEQVGWYAPNGRAVGLKLAFAGGHVACLTYEEIRSLVAAAEAFNSE